MKPPAPTTPLSSAELEQDARKARVPADEMAGNEGDPHLPASEGAVVDGAKTARPLAERALTNLPPG